MKLESIVCIYILSSFVQFLFELGLLSILIFVSTGSVTSFGLGNPKLDDKEMLSLLQVGLLAFVVDKQSP